MPSSWERNRWVILSTFALEGAAFKIVMPFVPLYMQELGLTDPAQLPLWSGVTLAAMPLAVAAMLPLWDRMAERTGRKFQVLRSLMGCAVGLAAMAAAQTAWQLSLAYLFEGLIAGFTPQMWTLVSTGAPAGGVGAAMGLLQAVDLSLSAIAPSLGGYLGDRLGFRLPYVLGAFLCLLALALMWAGYKDPQPRSGQSPSERPRGVPMREVMAVSGLFPILALAFLVTCFVPGLNPLVPLYLQGLASPGAPVATLSGLALTMGSVAGALAAAMVGRLSRLWTAQNLAVVSLVAGGVATALVPSIPSLEFAFALWIARSAFTGGTIALLYAVADQSLPSSVAKGAYANLSGAMIFGYAVGPLVTGILGAADLRWAFAAVGILLALMGAWAARAFGPRS